MSLTKVENMATLHAVVYCKGVWGHAPPGNLVILGVLRRILVHSEAYKEAHRAS